MQIDDMVGSGIAITSKIRTIRKIYLNILRMNKIKAY